MSAQSTISKLRDEIAKARQRGESDADIISALTKALTPAQLVALHREAVREDKTSLESHIAKSLYERASEHGVLSSTPGSSRLTAGATDITSLLGTGLEGDLKKSRAAGHRLNTLGSETPEQEATRKERMATVRKNSNYGSESA